MIDRTIFDLRIAEHTTTTARINASDWRQGAVGHRPLRRALAAALVAVAAHLAPERATRQAEQPGQRPATV